MYDWENKILTVDEVAAILRLTPRTVRELLKQSEIPGRKVGRVWRTDGAQLKKYLIGEYEKS